MLTEKLKDGQKLFSNLFKLFEEKKNNKTTVLGIFLSKEKKIIGNRFWERIFINHFEIEEKSQLL